MAINTIYKCDHCGHEQDKPEQMWNISIAMSHLASGGHTSQYYNSLTHNKQQLWCRECIEKQGILCGDKNPNEQKPPQPIPTIEDTIRELMREEIANARENL